VDGLRVREDREARFTGRTVRLEDLVTPPYKAKTFTAVEPDTGLVVIANVAPVAPLATVTLAGRLATDVALLDSDTTAPPTGAGPLSFTVPVDPLPPVTLDGVRVRDVSNARMSKLIEFEVPPPGGGV
jgi:hypothetical protein